MAVAEVLSEYLSRDDLAGQLDKSVRTLERWERQRTGPRITNVGNRVMYHVDDVRAWLRAQRREAPHALAS